MTIQTFLQFGDNDSGLYNKSYLVVDYKCHISRPCSAYMPHGKPVCDSIDVTVIAPDKEDLELYEWFFTNSFKNGRILLNIQDVTTKNFEETERAIEFKEAQCFQLHERYEIDDLKKEKSQRRIMTMSFIPKTYTADGIEFERTSEI